MLGPDWPPGITGRATWVSGGSRCADVRVVVRGTDAAQSFSVVIEREDTVDGDRVAQVRLEAAISAISTPVMRTVRAGWFIV